MRAIQFGLAFVAPALVSLLALAARGDAPSTSVLLLFSIAKSENKNQVQYAVRVDDHCVPIPGTPIFAYWRMLEQGATKTAPLLPREIDAYGAASQLVTVREADGGKVRLVLKAVPSRVITVETSRGPAGACRAVSTVAVNGVPAQLYNVYVRLGWLYGVDYLLLQGWSMDGTHVVSEKLSH